MSACALEEPHDIDKYQHQIWNLPMNNYEQWPMQQKLSLAWKQLD